MTELDIKSLEGTLTKLDNLFQPGEVPELKENPYYAKMHNEYSQLANGWNLNGEDGELKSEPALKSQLADVDKSKELKVTVLEFIEKHNLQEYFTEEMGNTTANMAVCDAPIGTPLKNSSSSQMKGFYEATSKRSNKTFLKEDSGILPDGSGFCTGTIKTKNEDATEYLSQEPIENSEEDEVEKRNLQEVEQIEIPFGQQNFTREEVIRIIADVYAETAGSYNDYGRNEEDYMQAGKTYAEEYVKNL